MKNKVSILLAQLEHMEEYVEIIDKLDPIEGWAWGLNYQTGSVELHLAGKKEIHTITITPVRTREKNKK